VIFFRPIKYPEQVDTETWNRYWTKPSQGRLRAIPPGESGIHSVPQINAGISKGNPVFTVGSKKLRLEITTSGLDKPH